MADAIQINGQENGNKFRISKRDVAAYFLLPQIIPQIRELGKGGFAYLAYLIAVVYRSVRILPDNHPYVNPKNFGTFGIRQVIAEAANHVTLSKKNIDQIVIFFAILSALVILVLQILSFFLVVFSGDAFAQTGGGGGGGLNDLFTTQNPDEDIAFHLMREVFGIPDMFGTLENGRTPYHQALHVMLNFYNLAILLVAVLVFIYYVIVVVTETAKTGVPFGQRFSHIYAPFRLVIAIGLLVPLNYGLNGSQYVTLYAAKLGSGFATNAWVRFNQDLKNPTGQDNSTLIAETKAPDIDGLVEFMAVVVTCKEAYKEKKILSSVEIDMYIITEKNGEPIEGSAANGITLVKNQDLRIIFGANHHHAGEVAEIYPYCGTIVLPVNVPLESSGKQGNPGKMTEVYAQMIDRLWSDETLALWGAEFSKKHNNQSVIYPDDSERQNVIKKEVEEISAQIKKHFEDARRDADFDMLEETKKKGWGGAGIWYNRIAQVNGAYVVASFGVPNGEKWPRIMEYVLETNRKANKSFIGCEAFAPNLSSNNSFTFHSQENDRYLASVMNDAYKYWSCNKDKNAANFFLDTAAAIFGLNGLISIRDTADVSGLDGNGQVTTKKAQIHPLAKLSALGRGLVESAVRSLGFAMGASFAGGMLGILSPQLGAAATAASSMFVSIATIGLSIGFITYYILPFMPFMYFFFAVGSWVKSIFEAMVGAPLWALAHLRIDGDGIPGKMANNGYFLIFEIFLRPILTVFGLLAGMTTFTALATILNEIFDLVVLNTASVDLKKAEEAQFSRHIVDIFFFTCLYAVILYMMALASFKMINMIPQSILRWIGNQVSSFSDMAKDPVENLTQYAAIGGAQIGGQVASAGTQLTQGLGSAVGGVGQALGLGGSRSK